MMPQELPELLPLSPSPARPPGRVIRPLPPAFIAPAPPVGGGDMATDPALSAFWQNRSAIKAQGEAGLAGLRALNTAVDMVQQGLSVLAAREGFRVTTVEGADDAERSRTLIDAVQSLATSADRLSRFAMPSPITVTAKLADEQVLLLERSAQAIEALAKTVESCCGNASCGPQAISNRAFSAIARLGTLLARLMDRHDVTLTTVLQKLADQNQQLIGEIAQLLDDAALPDAAAWFRHAIDVEPFAQWRQAGVADNDPRVYAELNHRVSHMLAVQCTVARHLRGEAADWPPNDRPDGSTATPAASPKGGRASRRPN
jgi:hypothetical protein